jgi:hypothetical protein
MPEIAITLSEKGIHNVRGHVSSVAEGNQFGLMNAKISLALDLLDRTAKEFSPEATINGPGGPQIFVRVHFMTKNPSLSR